MRLTSKPVLCNYYVTYRCNASCSFCDIWEKPSPYITEKDVRENLSDLKDLGVKVIDFTGGEPLLHRNIDAFLKLAKEMGFITTLTTNTLLYPKRAKSLQGLVDMLHFSLDYSSAEKHDQLRGVGCFQFVKESIKIAKSLGDSPDILMTVTNDNIFEIPEIYQEFILPNNLMLILNPVFTYNGVGEELSNTNLNYLNKWASKKLVFLNEAFIELRKNGGNSVNNSVCKAASTTIVISPENELLLPCYHLSRDTVPINGNLANLWKSHKIQKLIKLEGKLPECEGCTINCYMQPSFTTFINKYFWKSLKSTIKYNYIKGTWKKLQLFE